jgi:hypothetical protein
VFRYCPEAEIQRIDARHKLNAAFYTALLRREHRGELSANASAKSAGCNKQFPPATVRCLGDARGVLARLSVELSHRLEEQARLVCRPFEGITIGTGVFNPRPAPGSSSGSSGEAAAAPARPGQRVYMGCQSVSRTLGRSVLAAVARVPPPHSRHTDAGAFLAALAAGRAAVAASAETSAAATGMTAAAGPPVEVLSAGAGGASAVLPRLSGAEGRGGSGAIPGTTSNSDSGPSAPHLPISLHWIAFAAALNSGTALWCARVAGITLDGAVAALRELTGQTKAIRACGCALSALTADKCDSVARALGFEGAWLGL